MFERDQKKIGKFARKNAANMFRTIQFVLCTIQQPLSLVPEQMADIDAKGENSRFLWGFKNEAWLWHKANQCETYDAAMAIYDAEQGYEREQSLIHLFAAMPGLGIVKGGFAVQCIFGLSACLDSHNIALHGLDASIFRASRYKGAKTQKTRDNIVVNYIATCDALGGTAALWDQWCEHVNKASMMAGHYNSASDVSRIHCTAIGIN